MSSSVLVIDDSLTVRMDLIEAEAVGDLVEAETWAQRAQALRQLDGALGVIYRDWGERLRVLLAQQEALIDFPDEDLPVETEAVALRELAAHHGLEQLSMGTSQDYVVAAQEGATIVRIGTSLYR